MKSNYYGIQQSGDGSIFDNFLHEASFTIRSNYSAYMQLNLIPFVCTFCLLKSAEGMEGCFERSLPRVLKSRSYGMLLWIIALYPFSDLALLFGF